MSERSAALRRSPPSPLVLLAGGLALQISLELRHECRSPPCNLGFGILLPLPGVGELALVEPEHAARDHLDG